MVRSAVRRAAEHLAQRLGLETWAHLGAAQRAAVGPTERDSRAPGPTGRLSWRRTLIIIAAFLIGALLVRDDFSGPEDALYAAYAESVLVDGDLNIANHAKPDVPPDLSPTYAFPDFHNHGGVVVWVPALLLGELSAALRGESAVSPAARRYTLSLANLACALAVLLLTLSLVRRVASRSTAWMVTGALTLGTPFVYYALLEPGQANLPAALFSTLLLYHLWTADPRRRATWLLTGLLAGLCWVVKIDAWFVLAFALAASLFFQRAWGTPARTWSLALAGFAVLAVAKGLNDGLRLGTWPLTELSVVNVGGFYLGEQLFAPLRGYFFYSPVFLLALGLGGLVALRPSSTEDPVTAHRDGPAISLWPANYPSRTPLLRLALLALVGVIVLKLFATAFRFNWGGGTFGGRLLLSELAPFALLLAFGLERLRSPVLRRATLALAALAVAWNGVKLVEFAQRQEPAAWPTVAGAVASLARLAELPETWLGAMGEMPAALRLAHAIPLVVIAAGVVVLVGRTRAPARRVALTAGLAAACYVGITVLNVVNHNRGAREVAAQVETRANALVLAPEEYPLMENMISLDEARAYFKVVGDRDQACRLAHARAELWYGARALYRQHRPMLAPGIDLGESCQTEPWIHDLTATATAPSPSSPTALCPPPPATLEAPSRPLAAELGGVIALVGVDFPSPVAHGARFPMTLYFRAEREVPRDYLVFVHFDRGATGFHANHHPRAGTCGTTRWPPGQIIADRFEVTAGERGRQSGRYSVWVGLYHGGVGRWETLEVTAAELARENRVYVGRLDVR